MARHGLGAGLAVAVGLGVAGATQAVPVTYVGNDPGVGPGQPRPNSDAARADWLAALGGTATARVDFEGGNDGAFVLSGDIDLVSSGVLSGADNLTLGFNTTTGGTSHLRFAPTFGFSSASVRFDYSHGIYAWGAYLTGLEPDLRGTVTVGYLGAGPVVLKVPQNQGAGVSFFGFVDAGASIVSVTLTELGEVGLPGRDIWGGDDVTSAPGAVPVAAPATLALLGLGVASLGLGRRRAG
jgi:hypothetical protein